MAEVTLMLVPGRTIKVVIADGATVLDACVAAERKERPDVEARRLQEVTWVGLAKDRQVKVNGRLFSNKNEVPREGGYVGSICSTPLLNGQNVMILKKIKGNERPCQAVFQCTLNGVGYALERSATELKEVVYGVDYANLASSRVEKIMVNGREAHPTQVICNGDRIEVIFKASRCPGRGAAARSVREKTTTIDDHEVTGTPGNIKAVIAGKDTNVCVLVNGLKVEGPACSVKKVLIGEVNNVELTIEGHEVDGDADDIERILEGDDDNVSVDIDGHTVTDCADNIKSILCAG